MRNTAAERARYSQDFDSQPTSEEESKTKTLSEDDTPVNHPQQQQQTDETPPTYGTVGVSPFGHLSPEDQAQLMKQYTQSLISAQAAQDAQPVNMTVQQNTDAPKKKEEVQGTTTSGGVTSRPRPRPRKRKRATSGKTDILLECKSFPRMKECDFFFSCVKLSRGHSEIRTDALLHDTCRRSNTRTCKRKHTDVTFQCGSSHSTQDTERQPQRHSATPQRWSSKPSNNPTSSSTSDQSDATGSSCCPTTTGRPWQWLRSGSDKFGESVCDANCSCDACSVGRTNHADDSIESHDTTTTTTTTTTTAAAPTTTDAYTTTQRLATAGSCKCRPESGSSRYLLLNHCFFIV